MVWASFCMAVMECTGKASLGRVCNGVAVVDRLSVYGCGLEGTGSIGMERKARPGWAGTGMAGSGSSGA